MLLAESRKEETARSVVQAVFAGLGDGKGKTGDAIRVLELLCKLQAEETASLPEELPEETDMSRYTDEELRAILKHLGAEDSG